MANMAQEYSRIIYNVKRPGPMAFPVSIPMYMYRIKTRKFKFGLDFFQKAVLRFKAKPGIENYQIAACLGFDESLIDDIQGVLVYNGYISVDGRTTPEGDKVLNSLDSIVIDDDNDEIGYVFQFVDRDDYLPYYVKQIGESPNLTARGDIIIGTKGDDDKTISPVPMTFIESSIRNLPFPSERVIFDLIGKSARDGIETERMSATELRSRLSVNYLHDRPEPILVNVCTYVYLSSKDDDKYDPEWQILDPFSNDHKPSAKLKFYIESFRDSSFKKELTKHFKDAKLNGQDSFDDYNRFMDKQVNKIIESEFGVEYGALDVKIKQYLNSVVKNLFKFRQYNYNDTDSGDLFVISCQKVLERIFILDKSQRETDYELMANEYSTPAKGDSKAYYQKRRTALLDLMRGGIITVQDKDMLMKVNGIEPNRAHSLKHYIYTLFLTYYFDNNSPLYKVIKGKIQTCFDIANMRNGSGHAEEIDASNNIGLNEELAENTFNFIRDFINQYMSVAL